MQDIKDAESDSVRDLTGFLDAELDYHERCAEELRRVRRSWVGASAATNGPSAYGAVERRPTGRSRSNTAHSYTERLSRTTSNNIYEADEPATEPEAQPVRMPIRSRLSISSGLGRQQQQQPDVPSRPTIGRANTFQGGACIDRERCAAGSGRASGTTTPNGSAYNISNMGSLRGQLRPVGRISTRAEDVFADGDDDTASGSGSPNDWNDQRSASPATSFGSLTRSTSNLTMAGTATGGRKAPPPPPPSRSKKPPPPIPAKREAGY
jgi:hypothetical protein